MLPIRRGSSSIFPILVALALVGCSRSGGGSGSGASAAPASTRAPAAPVATPSSTTAPAATSPPASATTTAKPVLVVVGLQREEQIAQGPNVVTVVSGSDPVRLQKLLAALNPRDYRAVVSFGIGGGLDPNLQPGDLLIAKGVTAPAGSYTATTGVTGQWTADANLLASLDTKIRAGGITPRIGLEAAEDGIFANDAAAKAQLRVLTTADEVDMESHVAAAWAAANGLPFAALRAVSDPASRGLPPAALLPQNANGTTNYGAIIGSLLTNPGQVPLLIMAYLDSETAFRALERVRQILDLGGL